MEKEIKGSVRPAEGQPVKHTIGVTDEVARKLLYIASMEDTVLTDLLYELIQSRIDLYEKENGPIPGK